MAGKFADFAARRVQQLVMAAIMSTALSFGLAACHDQGAQAPEPQATEVPKAVASGGPAGGIIESQYGTPVKDRVATLGLLNKRNNETQDLVLKTGEARQIGNIVVKLATCEKTLPWEHPPETGAFVQVFVDERDTISQPLTWHKVFSGWLFKNSPSLNVVEHPVYDVWVKDCAMKFPGEENRLRISPLPANRQRLRATAVPRRPPAMVARPPPRPRPPYHRPPRHPPLTRPGAAEQANNRRREAPGLAGRRQAVADNVSG